MPCMQACQAFALYVSKDVIDQAPKVQCCSQTKDRHIYHCENPKQMLINMSQTLCSLAAKSSPLMCGISGRGVGCKTTGPMRLRTHSDGQTPQSCILISHKCGMHWKHATQHIVEKRLCQACTLHITMPSQKSFQQLVEHLFREFCVCRRLELGCVSMCKPELSPVALTRCFVVHLQAWQAFCSRSNGQD